MCSKTTTLGGVTISEGTQVVVPIDLLHHNPEHWPDPHKFDPERYVEKIILLTALGNHVTYCIHWAIMFLSLTAYIGQS